jgi:hypothetical protein
VLKQVIRSKGWNVFGQCCTFATWNVAWARYQGAAEGYVDLLGIVNLGRAVHVLTADFRPFTVAYAWSLWLVPGLFLIPLKRRGWTYWTAVVALALVGVLGLVRAL